MVLLQGEGEESAMKFALGESWNHDCQNLGKTIKGLVQNGENICI